MKLTVGDKSTTKLLFILLLSISIFQIGCQVDYLTPKLVASFGNRTKGIQVYLHFKGGNVKLVYVHMSQKVENQQDIAAGKAKEEQIIKVKEREIEIVEKTPGIILDYSRDSIRVDFGANIILLFKRESGREWYKLAQETLILDGTVYKKSEDSSDLILLSIDYNKIVKTQKDFESKKAPGKVLE